MQMQKSTPIDRLPLNLQQTDRDVPVEHVVDNTTTIQDALDALNDNPTDYYAEPVQPNVPQQQVQENVDVKTKIIEDLLTWNDDIKIALYATAIFVLVNVIPIENFVFKYISIDKIPHANLLVKASLMFVAVLLISKFSRLN
jgi:hypothetical protein